MPTGPLANVLQFLRRQVTPSGAAQSDRDLLEAFARQRDESAFAALVDRHGPMVLSVCRRVLRDDHAAEDAFQATFVVLARKAGAGGWQTSLGSWLYEVAFRCASKARASEAARRRREQQVPAMSQTEPTSEADRRELRALLDEEIAQLPEKYRAPLVLCYLEGKSNEEAATLLGWPVGSVYGRLSRARDMLRGRLERRQVAFSAGAAALLLTESPLLAAVSPTLREATLRAAMLPAGAALAAPVATLAQEVVRGMLLQRLRRGAISALALVALAGGVTLWQRSSHGGVTAPAVPSGAAPKPAAGPEPAVKDGLAMTVVPVKAVFPENEALAFVVTFKNVSDKSFRLWDIEWDARYQIHIDGSSGPAYRPSRRGVVAKPPGRDASRLLAPGASLDVRVKLPRNDRPQPGKPPKPPIGVGKFTATTFLTVTAAPYADFTEPHWTGEITSRPTFFTIAADRSRP